MPTPSTIVITYDSTDITNDVLFETARFESQLAAVPGAFEFTVKDMDQTANFVTGKEVTLDIDGVRLFGGYVLNVSRKFAFPVVDTTTLANVEARQWVLRGVDYNVILDKRVLRQTTNYTRMIPKLQTSGIDDGEVIRTYFATYFDLPAGFDSTSTARIRDTHNYATGYRFPTQGTKLRDCLAEHAQFGSVFYVDGEKRLWFLPVEDTVAPWGFSDKPNGTTTFGFREGEFTEDATAVVNDALVWGGSEWAGNGDVVFARRQNTTSQTNHGRWQIGENNVGNANYKSQAEVNARANVIVDGNESGTFAEGSKGLVNPESQFKCTWFAHDVPSQDHLKPGDAVPIELWVFSQDAGVNPFEVTLPLRQIQITFPTLSSSSGDPFVQFEGFFGLQNNDPYWLWDFIRSVKPQQRVVATANNDSVDDPPYGAFYQGAPSPAPNGSTTVFTIPWPYIGGTISVYVDGIFKTPGTAFTESDPATGEFTMTTAPSNGSQLYVTAFIA